jgi:hypothetical protein
LGGLFLLRFAALDFCAGRLAFVARLFRAISLRRAQPQRPLSH